MTTPITQMTQQVINALKQLATTSKTAATNLSFLESEFKKLASQKISGNFDAWAHDLEVFSATLKKMGMDSQQLKVVETNINSLMRSSMGMDFGQNFRKMSNELDRSNAALKKAQTEIRAIYREYENIAGKGGGKDLFAQFTSPQKALSFANTLSQAEYGWMGQAGAKNIRPGQPQQLYDDYYRLQKLLIEVKNLQASISQQKQAILPYKQYAGEDVSSGKGTILNQGGADKGDVVVNDAFYKSLNLSSAATKNFQAQLEKLGVTGYRVTGNVKDLNSGMRTLRFAADEGTGGVSKYTAVLDKAGNIVNTTQNKFRSFASGLARDVVEVLKWSIAIGAIYGPMRKLNELIEESKKIQADLVDVQISLGSSTTNLQNVFEASVATANETSSAVEGVIEGYTSAVAAAGGAANEAQRLATTEILVRDSMVLAKLASIGQKEALDTLVGGLRQANLELTDGMQLLDSWVAVSRNANVSINQLATTFAIVGSGAEEVGLSYSELNGLAAVMAETTKLSADEVGNAIRGIIATLQSDTASQEFAKYGIATKTLTGDLRNMMDILKELSMLGSTGVLDEKAMGALTQAGGGGARRGAQLSALVSNMSRVMDVIAVSEGASGDAASALELKMTTLESASQRLNNAFSALAQSLGMEGGIVDGLTAATNAFSSIINGVKELVSILKWATPILAMSGIGKLLMGSQTGARMLGAQLPAGIASLFTPAIAAMQGQRVDSSFVAGRDPLKNAPLSNWALKRLQGTGLGYTTNAEGTSSTNTMGGFLGSMFGWAGKQHQVGRGSLSAMNMMVPAMMMGSTLMSKDEDKWSRFGAQAGGTGIGMGLTALTGNAMWPMIGSIIATGFYEKFLTFEADIAKDWIAERERILDERANEPNAQQGAQTSEPRTVEDIEAELKESLSGVETFNANLIKEFANAGSFVAGMWTSIFGKEGRNPGLVELGEQDMTQSESLLALALRNSSGLDEETINLVNELLNASIVESVSESLEGTEIGAIRTSNIEAVTSIAATASEDLMTKALEDIAKGASGSIQNYLDYSQAATQYATTAGSLMTAQQQAGMDVMEPSAAVSFVTKLTPEEAEGLATTTTQIISSTAAIEDLQDKIAEGYTTGASDATMDSLREQLAAYTQQLQTAISILPGFQQALQQSVLTRGAESKILDLVEVPEGLTAEQRSEIMARAEEMWREVLELSGLSEEEINAYIQAQKDQIVRANNEIYPELTKTPQNFISGAAEEQGYTGASSNWGFMDLRENYTQESFMSQLIPKYTQLVASFKRNFGDLYKPDISEDYGFILQDGFTTMDVDLKLLNLAMQDLVELTREKGLEGIYNLPAGATFMVPASAFLLDRQTRAGMGGGGAVTTTEEEPIPYGEDRNLDQFPYRTGPRDREERLSISRDRPVTIESAVIEAVSTAESTTVPESTDSLFERFMLQEGQPSSFTTVTESERAKGFGIATPGTPTDTGTGFFDPLVNFGTGLIGALESLSRSFDSFFRRPSQFMPQEQSSVPPTETSQTLTPAPVGISLSVDSNIQLVVDGRTLATIIKPFLYEDLIRFSASSPSNTNRSVVG